MIKIRPMHDEVIVRLDDQDEKTKGGIYIPEAARPRARFASVVAVGPGLFNRKNERIPMGVKDGDRVLLRELLDHEEDLKKYTIDDVTYHIFREQDVLGIVEGEQP